MIEENNIYRYLEENLLSVSEAASILNLTPQRVNQLVLDGSIKAAKKINKTCVILKKDVLNYKVENEKIFVKEPNEVFCDMRIDDVVNKVISTIKKMDKIKSIEIYFYLADMIKDDYYSFTRVKNFKLQNSMQKYSFILKDINGFTVYCDNLNCGYGGTGPSMSEKIVNYIINDKEKASLVKAYRICKYTLNSKGTYDFSNEKYVGLNNEYSSFTSFLEHEYGLDVNASIVNGKKEFIITFKNLFKNKISLNTDSIYRIAQYYLPGYLDGSYTEESKVYWGSSNYYVLSDSENNKIYFNKEIVDIELCEKDDSLHELSIIDTIKNIIRSRFNL